MPQLHPGVLNFWVRFRQERAAADEEEFYRYWRGRRMLIQRLGTIFITLAAISGCATTSAVGASQTICAIAGHETELEGKTVQISSNYRSNNEYAWLENWQCPNVHLEIYHDRANPSEAAKAFEDFIYDPKSFGQTKVAHIEFSGVVRKDDEARQSTTKHPGGTAEYYIEIVDIYTFRVVKGR